MLINAKLGDQLFIMAETENYSWNALESETLNTWEENKSLHNRRKQPSGTQTVISERFQMVGEVTSLLKIVENK